MSELARVVGLMIRGDNNHKTVQSDPLRVKVNPLGVRMWRFVLTDEGD